MSLLHALTNPHNPDISNEPSEKVRNELPTSQQSRVTLSPRLLGRSCCIREERDRSAMRNRGAAGGAPPSEHRGQTENSQLKPSYPDEPLHSLKRTGVGGKPLGCGEFY